MAAGSWNFWPKARGPSDSSRTRGSEWHSRGPLAAEGFRGPGKFWKAATVFCTATHGSPCPTAHGDLGESFEILHTAVKPHACCRYMQGPIDAILALLGEQDIATEQLRSSKSPFWKPAGRSSPSRRTKV